MVATYAILIPLCTTPGGNQIKPIIFAYFLYSREASNKTQEINMNNESNNLSEILFFRTDPNYGPRVYDVNDKVLPPSQPLDTGIRQTENDDNKMIANKGDDASQPAYICHICNREFGSKGGRSNHLNRCKMKHMTSSATVITTDEENITKQSIYIIRIAEQLESLCSQAKILNLHLRLNFKKYQFI